MRGRSTGAAGFLEAFASTQKRAVVEHVLTVGVECPVVALARVALLARLLDKAVVERQVVAYGVLPGGKALAIVGELAHDELAYARQSEALLGRLQNGHRDKRYVRVRRLDHVLSLLALVGQ